MKSFKYIVASAVVAVVAAVSMTNDAQATNACTVADYGMAMGKSGNITVSGTTATVKFRVNGTNCTTPVTIAVWKRVSPEGIRDQKFFNSVTYPAVAPGVYTKTITIPDCLYQVDVLEGAQAKAADGTADYVKWDGTKWTGPLRDFVKPAGTNVCVDKPIETPQSTTKGSPVAVVPNTGAGDILAGTAGLSTSVGLAYNLIRRKKLMR